MPDTTDQTKSNTAVYCGRECRVVCFFTDAGREYVRIEFSDKSQLTVTRDQIITNN